MVKDFDKFCMQRAIDIAWKYQGITYPNPPVGAVIVDKRQKIIATGVHRQAGNAHAELDAVRNALSHYGKKLDEKNPNTLHELIIQKYNNYFAKHTIYVTLEPCNHQGKTPPCSLLLKSMGFERVVISILDSNKIAIGGAKLISNYAKVDIGILKDEGEKLISLFNIWQKKKPFIFFKVAVDKNFTYTDGIISSQKSREFVHKIREKCDLLVIGGDTVRIDRPKLDTRLSSGQNPPDVLILSQREDFDRTIPLFLVKNRKVMIDNDFDKVVSNYKYIMVEGGERLFNLLENKLDAVMIFQTKNILDGKRFIFGKNFKRLKRFKLHDDTIEWKIRESVV